MNQRKTWGELRDNVGQVIGMGGNHPDLREYFNEISCLLYNAVEVIGKFQYYKIKVSGDCHGNRSITWPDAIETIEAARMADRPIGIRNVFFAFQANATGRVGDFNNWGFPRGGTSISLMSDRQEVVSNEDITGCPKNLKVYSERIEEGGRILLLGYNEAGNFIRTYNGECWQDGEYLDLANTPATTTNKFASLTGVQFTNETRNGSVYLYQVDSEGNEHQISTYDYAGKIPVFRRTFLTGLPSGKNQCECVRVLARMRFQPVIFDTDYPKISNVAAIKSGLQYLYRRDNDKIDDAEEYLQDAQQRLQEELRQYQGVGALRRLNVGPKEVTGTGYNMR